jgi:hypothetical protein
MSEYAENPPYCDECMICHFPGENSLCPDTDIQEFTLTPYEIAEQYMGENITVPKYVFDALEADSKLLQALMEVGVENTDMWDRAIEVLDEIEEMS